MNILEDKSIHGLALREKAVKLAIDEVAAYKNSAIFETSTERLIKSAEAIAQFIGEGKLPDK